MTRTPIPWARLLTESAAIVASILVAFALDAWWDGSREAAAMDEALGGVRDELVGNRALVERELGSLERIIAAGNVALEAMHARPEDPAVELVDSIAFLITQWAPSLDASFGGVDALIASARLAEVRDPELRLGLAGLRDRFADVVEEELTGRRIHVDQQVPLVGEHMELRTLAAIDAEFFSGPDVARMPVPHVGTVEYPNSRQIRNLVFRKIAWYGSARGEIRALLPHLNELIDRMDEELER